MTKPLETTSTGEQCLERVLELCSKINDEIDTLMTLQKKFYRNPTLLLTAGLTSIAILTFMSISVGHTSFQGESAFSDLIEAQHKTLLWDVTTRYEEKTYAKVDEFKLPNTADFAILVVIQIMALWFALILPDNKNIIQKVTLLLPQINGLDESVMKTAIKTTTIKALREITLTLMEGNSNSQLVRLKSIIEGLNETLEDKHAPKPYVR